MNDKIVDSDAFLGLPLAYDKTGKPISVPAAAALLPDMNARTVEIDDVRTPTGTVLRVRTVAAVFDDVVAGGGPVPDGHEPVKWQSLLQDTEDRFLRLLDPRRFAYRRMTEALEGHRRAVAAVRDGSVGLHGGE
ncbi:hypothetical protein ABZ543_13225 [Streptomyces roseifaciens]